MKVLIVDDDAAKRDLLRNSLLELSIRSDSIFVAEHAASAREQLRSASFDAMFLDVLLPARAGAQATGEVSAELLREIVLDGSVPAPKYILGVTADSAAFDEYAAEFRSFLFALIHIDSSAIAWRDQIHAFVRMVARASAESSANDFDICILVALREPELIGVKATWPLQLGSEELLGRHLPFWVGSAELNGTSRSVALVHQMQMGPVAAVHAAERALRRFRPRLLLMSGICGGLGKGVGIGDVVVAERSWDWQAGKWYAADSLKSSTDQQVASTELIGLAPAAKSALLEYYHTYSGLKPAFAPNLHIAPMATGSAVVASSDVHELFKDQHRDLAAVDMECYGIYYAAKHMSEFSVEVLCAKGVADLATRKKGDTFHEFCSRSSAVVLLDIAHRYFAPSTASPQF